MSLSRRINIYCSNGGEIDPSLDLMKLGGLSFRGSRTLAAKWQPHANTFPLRSLLPEQLDDDRCADDQFPGVIPRLLCLRNEERVKIEPDISEVGLR
jgi:hypothetical protein